MPKSKVRKTAGSVRSGKQPLKRRKRRSLSIRRLRFGTFLFGVAAISEYIYIPKKDRYIMIGLIFFEVKIGRFYG